jgi:hypothetical protein
MGWGRGKVGTKRGRWERQGRVVREDKRRTSAAPLAYWAWPPIREGCCCWSEDMLCVIWVGVEDSMVLFWFKRFGRCLKG